jgi:hypothetical protein
MYGSGVKIGMVALGKKIKRTQKNRVMGSVVFCVVGAGAQTQKAVRYRIEAVMTPILELIFAVFE